MDLKCAMLGKGMGSRLGPLQDVLSQYLSYSERSSVSVLKGRRRQTPILVVFSLLTFLPGPLERARQGLEPEFAAEGRAFALCLWRVAESWLRIRPELHIQCMGSLNGGLGANGSF